jgi:hypothetical protein
MDPRLIARSFIREKLKEMNTEKKPFWLTFKNAAVQGRRNFNLFPGGESVAEPPEQRQTGKCSQTADAHCPKMSKLREHVLH